MRDGLPSASTTITLETWIKASWVTMPPDCAPRWVCEIRVCFLTLATPSTRTLSVSGWAWMTLPLAPLSLPAMTTTVSPFLTFMSEHLRCQRDDLHELLVAQLTADRSEDAGTPRLVVRLDEHGGVLVEPDVGTVGTTALLHGPHDDGLDDIALLHVGAGDGLLHRRDDDVPDARVAAARATENTDAKDFLRTGVVGDAQPRLLLDHLQLLTIPGPPDFRPDGLGPTNYYLAFSRISTSRQRLVAERGRVSMR